MISINIVAGDNEVVVTQKKGVPININDRHAYKHAVSLKVKGRRLQTFTFVNGSVELHGGSIEAAVICIAQDAKAGNLSLEAYTDAYGYFSISEARKEHNRCVAVKEKLEKLDIEWEYLRNPSYLR